MVEVASERRALRALGLLGPVARRERQQCWRRGGCPRARLVRERRPGERWRLEPCEHEVLEAPGAVGVEGLVGVLVVAVLALVFVLVIARRIALVRMLVWIPVLVLVLVTASGGALVRVAARGGDARGACVARRAEAEGRPTLRAERSAAAVRMSAAVGVAAAEGVLEAVEERRREQTPPEEREPTEREELSRAKSLHVGADYGVQLRTATLRGSEAGASAGPAVGRLMTLMSTPSDRAEVARRERPRYPMP